MKTEVIAHGLFQAELQTAVRECKAKTLSALPCLGQHSAPQGFLVVYCLNVSNFWQGADLLDEGPEMFVACRGWRRYKFLLDKFTVASTQLKNNIPLFLDYSEPHTCCSSTNPYSEIKQSQPDFASEQFIPVFLVLM